MLHTTAENPPTAKSKGRGLAQPYCNTTRDAPPVAVSRVGRDDDGDQKILRFSHGWLADLYVFSLKVGTQNFNSMGSTATSSRSAFNESVDNSSYARVSLGCDHLSH